jgi:hypothetical protein
MVNSWPIFINMVKILEKDIFFSMIYCSRTKKFHNDKFSSNYEYLQDKAVFLLESFNTNISHQLFDYTKTFVNLQHKNTNLKGDLYSDLNVFLKIHGIQK